MLSNPAQRAALIAFVDSAMGGADRSTEAGVTWLPLIDIEDPPVGFALTIDESKPDGLHVGVGIRVRTSGPVSSTTLAVPLFRVTKDGGAGVSQDTPLAASWAGIRTLRLADGPDEVHNRSIALNEYSKHVPA